MPGQRIGRVVWKVSSLDFCETCPVYHSDMAMKTSASLVGLELAAVMSAWHLPIGLLPKLRLKKERSTSNGTKVAIENLLDFR